MVWVPFHPLVLSQSQFSHSHSFPGNSTPPSEGGISSQIPPSPAPSPFFLPLLIFLGGDLQTRGSLWDFFIHYRIFPLIKPAFSREIKRIFIPFSSPRLSMRGCGYFIFFLFGKNSTQAQKKVFKLALIISTCCPNYCTCKAN